jgi:hypothetical protein
MSGFQKEITESWYLEHQCAGPFMDSKTRQKNENDYRPKSSGLRIPHPAARGETLSAVLGSDVTASSFVNYWDAWRPVR